MIKECPVIINNECVTVVKYDGIDIQFPSVGKDAKSVFVTKYSNGSYHITDSIEAETVDATDDESEQAETTAKIKPKKQSKRQLPKPSRLYRV